MRGPGRRRKMAKGGVCPRAAQRHGGGGKWATVHRAQKVVPAALEGQGQLRVTLPDAG